MTLSAVGLRPGCCGRPRDLGSSPVATQDPWATLGVNRSATIEEVRASYRELLALYHPDRHAGAPQNVVDRANERTRAITDAWVAIRDGLASASEPRTTADGVASSQSRGAPDTTAEATTHAPVAGLTHVGRLWLPPTSTPPIPSTGVRTFIFGAELPAGPSPHPNVFWVDRNLQETRAGLLALAKAMGLRSQPKASLRWLLFTRSTMSGTGVVIHLTDEGPTRTQVSVKGHQRVSDLLQEFFGAVRTRLAFFMG